MAEAWFLQLAGDPPEAVLPALLGKALGRGWTIELRATDAARIEALDRSLWGQGDDWLPHGIAGGPHDDRQPVLLTVGPGAARDCLVAVDGAPVSIEEMRAAARACLLFDGADPAALAAARAQWKAATGAGIAARYYERADGAWALRQERPARD